MVSERCTEYGFVFYMKRCINCGHYDDIAADKKKTPIDDVKIEKVKFKCKSCCKVSLVPKRTSYSNRKYCQKCRTKSDSKTQAQFQRSRVAKTEQAGKSKQGIIVSPHGRLNKKRRITKIKKGGSMAKKKNDTKGKGKKVASGQVLYGKDWGKVVGLILALMLFAVPAMAAGLGWSSDYAIKDNINVIAGSEDLKGSAGIFIGTIGEVKLESGKKMLGLGGASLHVGDTGQLVFTAVPVTLFDDMIQLGISADLSNFKWDESKDYLFSVGFSASGLVSKLWK